MNKDTEDMCRVGPGTVMGNFMRQYWMPAAMSSEVKADSDPMRLMLLGEKLLAFRDSEGRVGIEAPQGRRANRLGVIDAKSRRETPTAVAAALRRSGGLACLAGLRLATGRRQFCDAVAQRHRTPCRRRLHAR